jgi:hypothetical protein
MLLPWWSVALVGAAFALLWPEASAWEAGMAAGLGWGGLLAMASVQGPVGVLAGRLGELFHLPSYVLLVLTVLFAALLGWGAAALILSSNRSRRAELL